MGPLKTQTIEFLPEEDETCVVINSSDVTIVSCTGAHHNGSSMVKIKNIIDYCWEERYHMGQLLAVHMEGKYIAYGIKSVTTPKDNYEPLQVPNYSQAGSQQFTCLSEGSQFSKVKNSAGGGGGVKPGSGSSSVVRVVNRETSKRSLIKDLEGVVEDLAFAAIPNRVILACVDTSGNLLVHEVIEEADSIETRLLLNVSRKHDSEPSMAHRVFWCSYIPEEDPSNPTQDTCYEDIMRLLALTRNGTVELWEVSDGNSEDSDGADECEGRLEIEAHSGLITDAAFSPDGTAIATASLDGDCKFYQVYMHTDGEPRCLHQWKPHDGKPLSALFFLDNHKNHNPEVQFWKYAMTGADFNTELKLWSCETWKCLQTIRFKSRSSGNLKLKAAMDLGAGFVLMSDMVHRVLYVLQLKKKNSETFPFVCSITEFKLPYAILSLAIVDVRNFKPNSSFTMEDIMAGGGESEEEGAGGSGGSGAVIIKMFIVQPKSLQECHIFFHLPSSQPEIEAGESGEEAAAEMGYTDDEGLSDVPVTALVNDITSDVPSSPPQKPISLMTPDEFNSPPVKHPTPVMADSSTQLESKQPMTGFPSSVRDIMSPRNQPVEAVIMGFTSGGSSPSREIQEILSLQPQGGHCFIEDDPDSSQGLLDKEPCGWMIKQQPQRKFATKGVGTSGGLDGRSLESLETEIVGLRADVGALVQLVKEQSAQIQELREEVASSCLQRSEVDVGRELEETLGVWWQTRKGEVARELAPHLRCTLDQGQLTSKLSQSLTNQLNKVISPAMVSSLDQLKETVQAELGKKMNTTEQALKDGISKLVRNKGVIESLSSSVVASATPAINQFYKEAFAQTIPLFEKACENMFDQISETFQRGTQELKAAARQREEGVVMEGVAAALTQSVQSFDANIEKANKRLEECLAELTSRTMRLNNGSGPRSRAVTPALLDSRLLQAQISQLISQGQYNTAFQQALSASDLSLVSFVCEKVPPSTVFMETGCLLQQHILLSLIQQLSSDMSHYSELTHRYLEEAVMNLNTESTSTREHMPVVLTSLRKQLQHFISSNPTSPLVKRVRMLQMAVNSLKVA